ncbi:MAG: hypothetical protein MJZ52_00230 [Bacteroidales bacterium]|nr:hypothetical protein [Bacteroidales bacterium]
MITALVLYGILIVALIIAITFIVMIIVAYIRFHNGKITQDDLNSATEIHKKNRAVRKRKRTLGYHSTDAILGFK